MNKDHPRCNVGGDYWLRADGPPIYKEPCNEPAVARYQTKVTDNPEHWNYRCLEHVGWLEVKYVKIESL